MPSWFSRSERPQDPDPQLVERVRKLEEGIEHLRLEWADVLDKMGRWASRQAARDRVALSKLSEPADDGGIPATPTSPPTPEEAAASESHNRAAWKASMRRNLNRRGA